MTAGRRMKIEMTKAERKKRGQPASLDAQMEEQGVSEHDRAEVQRFGAWLNDSHAGLSILEQIDKYGADYLGYTPEEVASLRAQGAPGVIHDARLD